MSKINTEKYINYLLQSLETMPEYYEEEEVNHITMVRIMSF